MNSHVNVPGQSKINNNFTVVNIVKNTFKEWNGTILYLLKCYWYRYQYHYLWMVSNLTYFKLPASLLFIWCAFYNWEVPIAYLCNDEKSVVQYGTFWIGTGTSMASTICSPIISWASHYMMYFFPFEKHQLLIYAMMIVYVKKWYKLMNAIVGILFSVSWPRVHPPPSGFCVNSH